MRTACAGSASRGDHTSPGGARDTRVEHGKAQREVVAAVDVVARGEAPIDESSISAPGNRIRVAGAAPARCRLRSVTPGDIDVREQFAECAHALCEREQFA